MNHHFTRTFVPFLIITIIFSFTFIACSKSGDDSGGSSVNLNVDKTTIIISGDLNTTDSFSIQSDIDWKITSPANSWLSVNTTTGTGNGKIILKGIQKNTTGAARTVTLTISPAASANGAKTITVTQGIANPQWSKLYGGTLSDAILAIKSTADGHIIAVGATSSNNGDVTGSHGDTEGWIIKLDENGHKLWTKVYGGSREDIIRDVLINPDGSIVITGDTKSNDGDISGNYSPGNIDAWVMKLDANGNKIWSKVFGGSFDEIAYSIAATNDGGYILVGQTTSTNGTIAQVNTISSDGFFLKIDGNGNKVWSSTFGDIEDEYLKSVIALPDGSFIATGNTYSNSGDFASNYGQEDGWVIKVNNTGQKIWNKLFGGSQTDQINRIALINDGSLILAGTSYSNNIDLAGNKGEQDVWILKLDANGSKVWSKLYGSSVYDIAYTIIPTIDNGFLMAGIATAADNDVSGNNGGADAWLLKLDVNGNKQWDKNFGGSNVDRPNTILAKTDGTYIIAGNTLSNDKDVTGNRGSYDAWIFNIK